MSDDLTPPHWGASEDSIGTTDSTISALIERVETHNDVPVSEIVATIAAMQARLAAAEKMAEALRGAEVTIQNLINVMGTPDQQQCCDGRECGCMGATVYQEAEYYAGKDLKAIAAARAAWEAAQ